MVAHVHAPAMPAAVASLLVKQDGVIARWQFGDQVSEDEVRWRVRSGRWQRGTRSVYVTHSGPLTARQLVWVQLLSAGRLAVLAGLAAAQLDGFTLPRGTTRRTTDVLLPSGRTAQGAADGVRVRRTAHLEPGDLHPGGGPRRTRLPRSIVDAASWAPTRDAARTFIVSAVQQRLVRPEDLRALVLELPRHRFRAVLLDTCDGAQAGAQALGELDFAALCRRFHLPEPSRQVTRRDERGLTRWLDVYFDEFGLVIEIDGLWHMEASTWWADLTRANQHEIDGDGLLRFPNFVVRDQPEQVARTLAAALTRRGWTGELRVAG